MPAIALSGRDPAAAAADVAAWVEMNLTGSEARTFLLEVMDLISAAQRLDQTALVDLACEEAFARQSETSSEMRSRGLAFIAVGAILFGALWFWS